MDTRAKSPLRYPGGKTFIAKDIVALMKKTPHIHYVEPYFGGGSVFFSRSALKWDGENVGCSSVLNDCNNHLMSFWMVMSDPQRFQKFRNCVDLLALHKGIFTHCVEQLENCTNDSMVKQALYFWVKMRMSRGGNAKHFVTPVRKRLRGQVQDQVFSYLSAVARLPEFHDLCKDAQFECMDAIELIKREDTEGTLFYCDPPYLHVTRQTIDLYEAEMTPEQHTDFLKAIMGIKGKAIVSSYPNDMYDAFLDAHSGWYTKDIAVKKHMSSAKNKPGAVERLYFNFKEEA